MEQSVNLTITVKDCQEKSEICNTLWSTFERRTGMTVTVSTTTRQAGRGWLGWRGAACWRIKLSPIGEEHRPWSTQELRPWPWGSHPSNLHQPATACPWFTCVWLIYSDLEQWANYLHEMPLHLHECGLARGQPLSDRGNWFCRGLPQI